MTLVFTSQKTAPFICRFVAKVDSLWLPNTVVRFRALVISSGICGRLIGVGAGLIPVFRVPLPLIHRFHYIYYLHPSSRVGRIDEIVAGIACGLKCHPAPRK
jgi:hypothetical protein